MAAPRPDAADCQLTAPDGMLMTAVVQRQPDGSHHPTQQMQMPDGSTQPAGEMTFTRAQ